METIKIVKEYNITRYFDSENKLHRLDGPAVENTNGNYEYWFHGERHRLDGPAIKNYEREEWYKDNFIHRDGDLPAIIENLNKSYFKNGKMHRLTGPAFESPSHNCWHYEGFNVLCSNSPFINTHDLITFISKIKEQHGYIE